jgi:AAT family amino acid transporter
MAIIKILAIILFVICGLAIWLGLAASDVRPWDTPEGFIGGSIFFHAADLSGSSGGGIMDNLFPEGGWVMITLMIWTLVNFQGSEIVGLSAAETQNPDVNIPRACKNVAYRIILIYLIPIFVLTLIMPYFEGNIEKSIFADTLYRYGFGWGSHLFTVVTLIAAFSCANSGFYGTVRSLYGLSVEGLAPKFLSKLNRFSTPQNATLFTLAFIWLVFIFGFAADYLQVWGEDMPLYTALVGIAGFTGTLCWVGILYSQILFRKKLIKRGYDPKQVLTVKAKGYPWLIWFAIIVQVAAMVLLIFEDMMVFGLSMFIIIVPIIVFVVQKSRGKIRRNIVIGVDETTFDEKFPDKNAKA